MNMQEGMTGRPETVALGQGPMANNMEGGHIAVVQGVSFPRWQVTEETRQPDGTGTGIAIDLRRGAICRWFLVPHGDALIDASMCGFRLGNLHLVIPSAWLLKGGHLDHDRRMSFLAPIVDHLQCWWDERDGVREDALDEDRDEGRPDPGSPGPAIVIDRRALELLAALHAGARVRETQEGWRIEARTKGSGADAERIDVHAGELGDRHDSAGSQLVHNLLARRSDGCLVPTPAGRALAEQHGHPGITESVWSRDIPVEPGLAVGISSGEIDEPYALTVSTTARLRVSRKENYYNRDNDTVTIAIGDIADTVLSASAARTLVDHLAPSSVKGDRFTVGIASGATLSVGGGEDGVIDIVHRSQNARITLNDVTVRLLRSIMREASKRGGDGNSIEDVPVSYDAPDAYYTRARA